MIGDATLTGASVLLWNLIQQARALGSDPVLWSELARTDLPTYAALLPATVAVSAAGSILWSIPRSRAIEREIAFLTELDLRNTAEQIAGLAASGGRARPIEVASFVHPDVPGRLVDDPYRIRQIRMHLMGNAVKFTDRAEVVVRVGLDHKTVEGWMVRLEVSDTAIGIDQETIEALYRRSNQADASTTRRFGGTGFGLVISKRIVVLMGGDIGVESTPGVGSRFWFTLSLIRVPLDRTAPARASRVQTRPGS